MVNNDEIKQSSGISSVMAIVGEARENVIVLYLNGA